ncbi:uncharacterized protein LOC131940773 [Physella acuta]|uniref:uncharacterized protein LOC131940773 n=1 Tax=Physella acuta TaxID=109671 RepID=UPI0027DCDB4D|nr:uncharacterized protein LOC131940773 [Physella acuta]
MCHCKDNKNCGHTGTCSDGCEDGYFGYKCQYVDMFYSLAPRTYKTSDECNFEHLKNITLDSNYFRYARIVFKGDIPQFYTLNFIMEGDTDTHCDNFYQSKIDARTIEIICDQFIDIFMRSLSLVTDGDGVCRVSISRGRNLALKQQTMDPSTVDGNRYSTSACFYSQNWMIKFDIPSTIHNFIIYSKQEIYVHEMLTFISTYTYRTGDAFETFRVNFTAPYGKTYSSPTPVRFPWPVSEIEIRVVNTGKKIYFCEVEVFGEIHCGDHRYGLECETSCQCLHQVSDCQKQNACLFNCSGMGLNTCRFSKLQVQFSKLQVQQVAGSVSCRFSKLQVQQVAGSSVPRRILNGVARSSAIVTVTRRRVTRHSMGPAHVSPATPKFRRNAEMKYEVYAHVPYVPQTIDPYLPTDNATGQDPGSAGEECGSGFYGSHCMFVCSSWCDMQNCERENGTCYRCTIGRTGDFCEQKCSIDTYGVNCSYVCDNRCFFNMSNSDRVCNSVTGDCELPADPLLSSKLTAPNSTTFVDFLRILWDEQVGKIVMLNRDQEPYWSEEGKIIDTFRIKVLSTRVYADYTTRHIEIQKVDSPSLTNLLTHFHFTSWPEDGSDPCVWSLVDFEHRVFLKPTDSRTLVHCRNGTTRTSIFIALHDLILQAKIWNVIDFVKTVTKLRQDRSHMIETFITSCVYYLDKKYIPMLHDDSDPAGGYINAVTVTSLNVHPKQFLTQLPLPTTTNDFWRLVTQYNVSLIVAFNVLVKDSSLGSYLPETKGQPLPCGDLFVMVKSLTKRTIWEERVVTVRAKTFHEVTHLTYVAEEYDAKRLLPFVLMIRSLKTRDGAVVYTCRQVTCARV